MAVASLLRHAEGVAGTRRPPLVSLSPTVELLEALRGHHLRQFRPRAVLAAVGNWLISGGGGSPGGVSGGLRLAGESPDPHVLCFGPSLGYPRRFFHCLERAHAVVPYRVGEGRVYVYDPNHPGDRERFVEFRDGGGFAYGGFRSEEGWGITRVPLSTCHGRSAYAPDGVEWARPVRL